MDKRIQTIDSFRAISIIAVILYHFFSRWTPPYNQENLYPYANNFDFFERGKLGVQFFFIISGFVIYFTLTNTTSFKEFWKKRFARLVPSMFVASVCIFIFISLFDNTNKFPSGHYIINFIPSLTFISPAIFEKFGLNVAYLDGSFWSLWPEIQFYILASSLYFISKKHFLRNLVSISIFFIIGNFLIIKFCSLNVLPKTTSNQILVMHSMVNECFNILSKLQYFISGVLFFELYRAKSNGNDLNKYITLPLIFIFLWTIFNLRHDPTSAIIISLQFSLFFVLIFFPNLLRFLNNKIIAEIGKSSYFLYLIHQRIGVILIFSLCPILFPQNLIFIVILIFLLILLSIFVTKKIEIPLSKFIVGKK
jgi:peptidoglycan/LPS O-acetylase OafA/YrhL